MIAKLCLVRDLGICEFWGFLPVTLNTFKTPLQVTLLVFFSWEHLQFSLAYKQLHPNGLKLFLERIYHVLLKYGVF